MNATDTLHFLRNLSPDVSVLLVAKHGVGKSSLVRQVAEEIGGFYDVRLSQCEVGDIKGLPFLNKETKTTEFFKPFWWPRDMDSKGVLFFDELNRASDEVQQSVFEVCLDRRLDGDELPKGWRVVAAINGSDEYQVSELDPALLDRWFVIDFEPTVKEWCAWGADNGIHSAIREFVLQDEKRLDPPEVGLEPGRVYPSRRSWDKFNTEMERMNLWESGNSDMIMRLASGFLGLEIAVSFSSWFKSQYESVRPEEILKSYKKSEKVRRAVARLTMEMGDISAFGNSVSTLVGKKKTLTKTQFSNLTAFFYDIPPEVVSSMHSSLMKTNAYSKMVTKCREDGDMEFLNFLASLYCNSKSAKTSS